MITLNSSKPALEELKPVAVEKAEAPVNQPEAQGTLALKGGEIQERPDVVDARVYKLRSGFVKHNVYITLGWVVEHGRKRPVEIFFNSKDLTRSPEYAILTRLISALFRKSEDASFILEELRGIHDPNGGVYRNGRYMHSFYAEVAEVIERFFYDVGILSPKVQDFAGVEGEAVVDMLEAPAEQLAVENKAEGNEQFKFCPECQERTLVLENGCDKCMSCGYSKCDK